MNSNSKPMEDQLSLTPQKLLLSELIDKESIKITVEREIGRIESSPVNAFRISRNLTNSTDRVSNADLPYFVDCIYETLKNIDVSADTMKTIVKVCGNENYYAVKPGRNVEKLIGKNLAKIKSLAEA